VTITKGILEVMSLPTAQGCDLYVMGRKAYFGSLKPWDGYEAATPCVCGCRRVVIRNDRSAACRRCTRPRGQ
jgi:hypothetical protein